MKGIPDFNSSEWLKLQRDNKREVAEKKEPRPEGYFTLKELMEDHGEAWSDLIARGKWKTRVSKCLANGTFERYKKKYLQPTPDGRHYPVPLYRAVNPV